MLPAIYQSKTAREILSSGAEAAINRGNSGGPTAHIRGGKDTGR